LEIADRLQVAEGGPSLALAWAGADRPTESDRQRLRVSAREGRPREPTLLLLGEKGEVYSISCTVSLVTTHYCRHRALSQAKPKATRSRSSHADQPSSSHKIRLPTTPLELRPAPALPFHRDTCDTFHTSSTTSLPALCLNVPHVHHAAHVSAACLWYHHSVTPSATTQPTPSHIHSARQTAPIKRVGPHLVQHQLHHRPSQQLCGPQCTLQCA